MKCEMICMKCGEKFIYSKNHSQCSECKNAIEIDENIESLVVALNHKGFYTAKSCQGHTGDLSWPFPFVTLHRKEDYQRLEKLLQDYNRQVKSGDRWEVSRHPKVVFEKWLVPVKRKGRRPESLQRPINSLTEFLLKKPVKNVL